VLGPTTAQEYVAGACKNRAEMLTDELLENAAKWYQIDLWREDRSLDGGIIDSN